MRARLESYFGVRASGSNLRREVLGGLTTFLTMAYILVVNPVILSVAGMDRDGAFLATALASAFATLLMGVVGRIPIALAPGMGLNAFFAYTICAVVDWQVGLGMIVLVSVIFFLLTLGRVRTAITAAVPPTLRFASAVGIGLFIALIGFKNAGVVVNHPATFVTLGSLTEPHTMLALFALVVTLSLIARGVGTAVFWGVVAATLVGSLTGIVRVDDWVQLPTGRLPGFDVDIAGALRLEYVPLGITLLFFALFDAMGTLYAVGAEAKLLDEQGNFPYLGRALMVDAGGALAGGLLGTSPVTCYVESATGVNVGARTGLASVVTAACFLMSLFLLPLVSAIGAGVSVGAESFQPVTASALIVVGILMARSVTRIDWTDVTESVPAFLTMTVMPFTFSIAHGLAIGFISYTLMKLASGRGREAHWIVYALAALFILNYAFARMGH